MSSFPSVKSLAESSSMGPFFFLLQNQTPVSPWPRSIRAGNANFILFSRHYARATLFLVSTSSHFLRRVFFFFESVPLLCLLSAANANPESRESGSMSLTFVISHGLRLFQRKKKILKGSFVVLSFSKYYKKSYLSLFLNSMDLKPVTTFVFFSDFLSFLTFSCQAMLRLFTFDNGSLTTQRDVSPPRVCCPT